MYWDTLKIEIYDKWKKYWYNTHPKDVAIYSWDYLFVGGKEIRPKLFCELWNYLSPDTTICAELAFAIECIHVTSLILDDMPWMDNANERRGKKTLHTILSEKKALLICHDILNIVYEIWTKNKPQFIHEDVWNNFIKTKIQRLMVGQWYDLEKKGTLFELASLKTGVIFELVTETVALCIDMDTEYWRNWGNYFGILFQWTDDWFDKEEDIFQNNRNAFNEAYNITLNNYKIIWERIRSGIGKEWFNRPFGIFMKKYFIMNVIPNYIETSYSISLKNNNFNDFPYIMEIIIPELKEYNFEKRDIFKIINGKDMIKKMFIVSNHINKYESIKTNLWYVDENKWHEEPEIINIMKRVQDVINTNSFTYSNI